MHWCQPHVSGMTLPPLAAHGCTVINTSVYIFGGLSTNGASNTLYCLDTGVCVCVCVCVCGRERERRRERNGEGSGKEGERDTAD